MRKIVLPIIVATVLWFIMFSPWTAPHVNFWVVMTISALTLTSFTTILRKQVWSDFSGSFRNFGTGAGNLLLGVAIAAALWGVFWIGNELSQLMFNFARPQVDNIYGIKEGVNPWLLSLLLLFIIGPAEEIFWRGYVQNTLNVKYGANISFIITSLVYALVHAVSFNFMLVMAALVAGVVWGFLYRLFPKRFAAIVISHAIWDAAVFVWFPI